MKLYFILSILFFSCTKKKKEEATVSLPFIIESLSKTSIRKNDTLVLRGYILDQDNVNNTSITFNGMVGRVIYVTRDSVVVLVPQTTTGILTLKQNRMEASKAYRYTP
jgi:hypothetical protein